MSVTITDPDLLAKLATNRGLVELQDSNGETVGRVQTTWPAPLPNPLGSRDCFLERVTDSALLAAFARVGQPVLLFDPHGELVGRFERDWYGMPLTPARSREMEERRREARKQKGYTLAEVRKIIHEKYVGADVEPIIVESDSATDN
jgi:hypothetical protein